MLSSENISSRFETLLRKAGWTPDRCVHVLDWVGKLQHYGYQQNPVADSILESVGGLTVHLPAISRDAYGHRIEFDPIRAAAGEHDRTESWSEALGITFFPLGEEAVNGTVIWIGSDNQFYFGREYGLYFLGRTFEAAMDHLAFAEDAPPKVLE